jgi:putative transposase
VSKLHRLRLADKIFFITCNLRQDRITFGDAEFNTIMEVIEESSHRLGALFCGYVLMPDHWHALIAPTYPVSISLVMRQVKSTSSGRFNRLRDSHGANWQHQFWDRFIRHAKELSERLEYMHYNPVRKGLVSSPEEWRWSSWNNFFLDRKVVTSCPILFEVSGNL